MSTEDLTAAAWRKSSYSGNDSGCVEIAHLDGGRVAVRDTKDKGHGPVLTFLPHEWEAFRLGMNDGEFDRA